MKIFLIFERKILLILYFYCHSSHFYLDYYHLFLGDLSKKMIHYYVLDLKCPPKAHVLKTSPSVPVFRRGGFEKLLDQEGHDLMLFRGGALL
jgi:hypothetical protein